MQGSECVPLALCYIDSKHLTSTLSVCAQRTVFLPDLLPPGLLLLLLPGVLNTDGLTLPGVLVVVPGQTPDKEGEEGEDLTTVISSLSLNHTEEALNHTEPFYQ